MSRALPETASLREFAGYVPCKPSWVTELKRAGRLVLTEDGKRVRVAESLRRIEDTKDPSKAAVAARHAASRAASAPLPPDGGEGADGGDGADVQPQSSEFQRSRAEREKWAAKSAQLEYERSTSKLLDAQEVETAAAGAATVLRTSLEAIPAELAPLLAPITDETRVRTMLTDRIEHALQECVRQFGLLAKGTA
jgi:hypothetical protein